jgi:hypothetical protein
MRIPNAMLVAGLVTLMACQGSDVGTPCRLIAATQQLPTNPIDDAKVPADFVAFHVPTCDDLICIKSPQRDSGYCSRPCVSNSDCSTGLICRQLTFPETIFLDHPELKDQYAQYLGSVTASTYCATAQQ